MNSELRGKTAIDLTTPDSPVRNLLNRYSNMKGLSIKTSTETLQSNGNSNGHNQLQRSYSKMGPASPGAESFLSMEEVTFFPTFFLFKFLLIFYKLFR